MNNILFTSSINNYNRTREMISKNELGVYYSKRKSDSDKYAIKRYHQLMNENIEKPKLLETINKESLGRCIPSELLVRTNLSSRKVARIAAPDAALRQLELAEAGQANNNTTNAAGNNNNEEEEEEVVEEEDDFGSDDDYHKDHDNSDNDNDDDDGDAGI